MRLEQFFWMTQDNTKLRMVDMDPKHLQAAHTHACEKEFEYFQRQNIFNSLVEKLEAVAKARGIILKHPDERFPSKRWGKYFSSIRTTNQMKATDVGEKKKEAQEPVLASSKEVHTL